MAAPSRFRWLGVALDQLDFAGVEPNAGVTKRNSGEWRDDPEFIRLSFFRTRAAGRTADRDEVGKARDGECPAARREHALARRATDRRCGPEAVCRWRAR